jgi:hypothetical protein
MLAKRSCNSAFLATIIGLIGATQAVGENLCRPTLTVNEVEFSAMTPPALERTWSAVVAVDASACTPDSKGYFELVFTRLSEKHPISNSANSSCGRRLRSSGRRPLRWVWAWRLPQMKLWSDIGSKMSRRAFAGNSRVIGS